MSPFEQLYSPDMSPFAPFYGCVSVTTFAARQTPGKPGIVTKIGPDLPLLFKMHEIWSVGSRENY